MKKTLFRLKNSTFENKKESSFNSETSNDKLKKKKNNN